jgi:nitrogen fixation protein FixH
MSVATMENRLTGRHVLLILFSFFGIVFAVNGIFLYAALSTKPGEETGASYEAGVHYNSLLAGERAQAALGWHHKVQIATGSKLRLMVSDAENAPVPGLNISAAIERPATAKGERALDFKEKDAGVYEASIDGLEAGSWVVSFTGQKGRAGGEPAIYRGKERLWLGQTR